MLVRVVPFVYTLLLSVCVHAFVYVVVLMLNSLLFFLSFLSVDLHEQVVPVCRTNTSGGCCVCVRCVIRKFIRVRNRRKLVVASKPTKQHLEKCVAMTSYSRQNSNFSALESR